MADRSTSSTTVTHVRHQARPMGRSHENGPHLADLRAFVAACDGLPDDLFVRFESGSLDEGGRRTVTISASWKHPTDQTGEPS